MKLHIQTAQPYSVTIANGLLDQMGELALETQKPGSRAMLISETNVYPLYGERVKLSLERAGFYRTTPSSRWHRINTGLSGSVRATG